MEATPRYKATHVDAIMAAQGRSAVWLAKHCGVSRQYMSSVLNGRRVVSSDLAVRITVALGVPLFLAFELSDDAETTPEEQVA